MRYDHRPYAVKRAFLRFEKFYAKRFIAPQLESLGPGFTFIRPWHVEVFGPNIHIGKDCVVIATSDMKVRFCVWAEPGSDSRIVVGHWSLICPGVRISSASHVGIGDNCMLASRVYITDSDWHDIYDRVSLGHAKPVTIGENVWIGDSSIVCKGVTIGNNSIIGAGSVVTKDIPANCIAAGNPAKVVRKLDPDASFVTRSQWYADREALQRGFKAIDKEKLRHNTWLGWIRSILFPVHGD